MASSSSKNVQVALSAFDAIAAKDWARLDSVFASTLQWITLPASLGSRVRNKDEVLPVFKSVEQLTQSGTLKVEVGEIIEAPGRVIMHAKAVDTVSIDGGIVYANEYIFIFTLTEENVQDANLEGAEVHG